MRTKMREKKLKKQTDTKAGYSNNAYKVDRKVLLNSLKDIFIVKWLIKLFKTK